MKPTGTLDTVDIAAARRFLKALDPTATAFTWQCFDDVRLPNGKARQDPALARVLNSSLDELAPMLADLNNRGAGIFVTINRTDLRGRKAENIIATRAVWVECDDPTAAKQQLPLAPNWINETSPGKTHSYLFVNGLTAEEHRGVMRTLVTHYGSDRNAADLARVLRVPGFCNVKSALTPHLVRCIGGVSRLPGLDGLPYTRDEILKAFPPTAEAKPEKPAASAPGDFDRAKWFRIIGAIPADERATWLAVGMGLHFESGGDDAGFELWAAWAPNAAHKFDEKDQLRVWNSFGKSSARPTTGGTLVHLAREHGYRDSTAPPPPFEDTEAASGQQPPGPLTVQADTIERKSTTWVHYPYFPGDAFSLIGGRGGDGKGLVVSSFVAAITRGTFWPASTERAPHGRVLWGEAEDPCDKVLRPRWEAAGADLTRIDFMEAKNFPLLNLREYIIERDIKLIVLSPLVTFLQSCGLDETNNELKVRKTLELIQGAIEGTGCALIGICHLNKKADLDAIERLLGSVAFANFVRSVVMVACENRDTAQYRFVHAKHNWSVKGRDLLYTPECVGAVRSQDVRLNWSVPTENVDAASIYDRKKKPEKQTAGGWLAEYLQKNGLTARATVIEAAEKAGFNEATIDQALKRDNRCHSRNEGFPAKAFWWFGPS